MQINITGEKNESKTIKISSFKPELTETAAKVYIINCICNNAIVSDHDKPIINATVMNINMTPYMDKIFTTKNPDDDYKFLLSQEIAARMQCQPMEIPISAATIFEAI